MIQISVSGFASDTGQNIEPGFVLLGGRRWGFESGPVIQIAEKRIVLT